MNATTIAMKIAIIIKNSKELNGSIVKIVDRQIELPSELNYHGDYLMVNTNNKLQQQLQCIKLFLQKFERHLSFSFA